MTLSIPIRKLLRIYFNTVDPVQIGSRLDLVWNNISVPQQTAIKTIIQSSYFKMFTVINVAFNAEEVFQVIADCAEVLTPVQRDQLLTLIKTDIIAVYNDKKDDIDDDIADVNNSNL